MHVIAAKAVAFGEALRPEFKDYAHQVVANARAMGAALQAGGLDLVSGGTDSHIVLVDLRPKKLTGTAAEKALERAGITCNKNAIPFDPAKPMVTSGLRVGTPACTTRGFKEAEFTLVGQLIVRILDGLAMGEGGDYERSEAAVRAEVLALLARFPIYN
jgi:glycine hydroxymethyltransferase